jgi:hypothetical protein
MCWVASKPEARETVMLPEITNNISKIIEKYSSFDIAMSLASAYVSKLWVSRLP